MLSMLPTVNTILRRREPEGDAYDRLRVVGTFDAGEHGQEVVLAPVDGFASPISADPAGDLFSVYEVEMDGGEAPAWETRPEELAR